MFVQVPLFCNRNTNIILTNIKTLLVINTRKIPKNSINISLKMKKNATLEKLMKLFFPVALFCVYVCEFIRIVKYRIIVLYGIINIKYQILQKQLTFLFHLIIKLSRMQLNLMWKLFQYVYYSEYMERQSSMQHVFNIWKVNGKVYLLKKSIIIFNWKCKFFQEYIS